MILELKMMIVLISKNNYDKIIIQDIFYYNYETNIIKYNLKIYIYLSKDANSEHFLNA